MILVTLGTQDFPFDRLLSKLDDLVICGEIKEHMFAQTGFSNYTPRHYESVKMLAAAEFEKKLQACDLLITHGGTGSLVGALRLGKKVIATPRLKKYGEHVDDHQTEIISVFADAGLILRADDMNDLLPAIRASHSFVPTTFESGHGRMIQILDSFIQTGERPIL